MRRHRLLQGDSARVLRTLPAAAADALVTDPPAGIGFMGKTWDHHKGGRAQWVAWLAGVLTEARRVLKPGAWALVWALPRTSHWTGAALEDAGFEVRDCGVHLFGSGFPKHKSALKPAAEFWWLARVPGGRVPLNVDACRIETAEDLCGGAYAKNGQERSDAWGASNGFRRNRGLQYAQPSGRWPAHVTLDEEAAAALDAMSGVSKSRAGGFSGTNPAPMSWGEGNATRPRGGHTDSGGASRFFYCAKASRKERGPGNTHPTVKPVALMRWLVRLITPPGGLVLDPFTGSGTTGLGALKEGRRFLGIEREAQYIATARARLRAA